MNNIFRIAGVSLSALVAGCTVTPKPLTIAEIATTADRNILAVDANQEPVAGSIDLYEAMARVEI